MRVIEATVSCTRKVNLGNYESEDFFVALKGEIESSDDMEIAVGWLFARAENLVEKEAEKRRVKRDAPFPETTG